MARHFSYLLCLLRGKGEIRQGFVSSGHYDHHHPPATAARLFEARHGVAHGPAPSGRSAESDMFWSHIKRGTPRPYTNSVTIRSSGNIEAAKPRCNCSPRSSVVDAMAWGLVGCGTSASKRSPNKKIKRLTHGSQGRRAPHGCDGFPQILDEMYTLCGGGYGRGAVIMADKVADSGVTGQGRMGRGGYFGGAATFLAQDLFHY